MLSNFKNHLHDVIQKYDHIAFEDHVKNTCIKKLHACNDYSSIPSIARKKDQELQKEKRSKNSHETQTTENQDAGGSIITPQTQKVESYNKREINDEL